MASIRQPPSPTCSTSSSGGHVTDSNLLLHFSGGLPPIPNPHLSLHLSPLSRILIRRQALVPWTRESATRTCCAAELGADEATWMASWRTARPQHLCGAVGAVAGRARCARGQRPRISSRLEARTHASTTGNQQVPNLFFNLEFLSFSVLHWFFI